jgi:membrane protein YdbS with pleckstrin-like domain
MGKVSQRRAITYWRVITILAGMLVLATTILNLVTETNNWWTPVGAAFTCVAGITALVAINKAKRG